MAFSGSLIRTKVQLLPRPKCWWEFGSADLHDPLDRRVLLVLNYNRFWFIGVLQAAPPTAATVTTQTTGEAEKTNSLKQQKLCD